MPRVIYRAILFELGNAILTAAPKRTVLPYNDAAVLGRIRSSRIEILIGDSRPAHTTFPGTVDDACVHLAEDDDVVRVVPWANLEANEVVELEALAGARVS